MFAITEDAAAAIKSIVASPKLPEGAGLRITKEMNTEADGQTPRTDLRLSVVTQPEEGDEILEAERIFIDPEAAELLDNRLLDADPVDDDPRFSLGFQAESL